MLSGLLKIQTALKTHENNKYLNKEYGSSEAKELVITIKVKHNKGENLRWMFS